ncbi:PAS domain-containing protein [Tumidithrix elongata RA019]|uniref:histidine kinase n=1 Tax=Tumidithrix elongata BACA0141 TaxID=2716417 RepID=A0AAW9QA73_9CYAN|nr:PAS domain-containing protein [Tumidithrix elongata RA019]
MKKAHWHSSPQAINRFFQHNWISLLIGILSTIGVLFLWKLELLEEQAYQIQQPLPISNIILGGGLVMSWTMALLFYFVQHSAQNARRVIQINQKLQDEIAQHQMTESILRESEAFNRSIFENNADCLKVLDLEGSLIAMNENGKCLMEIDNFDKFRGKEWVQLWEEAKQAIVVRAIEVAKAGGVGHFQEFRPTAKGTPKWWDVLVIALSDSEGNPQRLISTSRDITASKQAEAKLRESEERYRSVIAAMSEGVILHQADGQITACNKSAEQILGLSPDQMMGHTSIDLDYRTFKEDGSPFPGDTHPAMVTLRTGQPQSNVLMGICKGDGTNSWITINSQPLFHPEESLPYAVVTSFADITDRKQAEIKLQLSKEELQLLTQKLRFSEQKLRTVFEAMTDVVLSIDADNQIEVAPTNPNRFYDREAANINLLELTVEQFFNSPDHDNWFNRVQQVRESQQTLHFDYRLTQGDREFWFAASIAPMPSNDVIWVAHDISHRKQAEEVLHQAKEQFGLAIQASYYGFWDWNLRTDEIYFSPRWKEMLGYADSELPNTLDTFIACAFEEDFRTKLQLIEDNNSGTDYHLMTQRFHHKNGSVVHVLSRVIYVKDDRGNVVRMIGAHSDITETLVQDKTLQ